MNTHSIDLELSSSQYLYCTDNVALSITGDITLEVWIKLEQLPSTVGLFFELIDKWNPLTASPKCSYDMTLGPDDKLGFYYSSNGTNDAAARTDSWSDAAIVVAGDVGKWVHIACSVDVSAKAFWMYKNGVLVADTVEFSNAAAIHDNASNFLIGAGYNSSGNAETFFDGLIDEPRVWNDIRTAEEILDNMSVELTGNEANLAGYWKLNNNYLDETSNNSDLTASGSPVFSTDVPFVGEVEVSEPFHGFYYH